MKSSGFSGLYQREQFWNVLTSCQNTCMPDVTLQLVTAFHEECMADCICSTALPYDLRCESVTFIYVKWLWLYHIYGCTQCVIETGISYISSFIYSYLVM